MATRTPNTMEKTAIHGNASHASCLKPQQTEETRKKPRDLRDYTFYDIHGNVFTPEIIKQYPKDKFPGPQQ